MVYMIDNGNTFETTVPQYYGNATRLSSKVGKANLRKESIAILRDILKPGDTVYSVLRSISSSGMSRCIDFYAIENNKPRYLSGYIANILSYKRHGSKQGIVVSGGGMDMGYHVVHSLGRDLFPEGFATDNPRNGAAYGSHDSDGGYALRHEWI